MGKILGHGVRQGKIKGKDQRERSKGKIKGKDQRKIKGRSKEDQRGRSKRKIKEEDQRGKIKGVSDGLE